MTAVRGKGARRVLGAVAVAAILGLLLWAARPHLADVRDALTPLLAGVLLLGVGLNTVANRLLADNWRRLLALLDHPLPTAIARRVWARGQLARFAIGSAQLLSRPALARTEGVPLRVGVTSTLLETAWMAGVTGAATLAFAPGWAGLQEQRDLLVITGALGLLGLAALTIRPALTLRPLLWAMARIGRPLQVQPGRSDRTITPIYIANALMRTIGFIAIVAAAAGGLSPSLAAASASAFLAGNLAGLVVVLAPGGLGPREAVSALLLAPVADGPTIVVALAAVRLVELAAEGLFVAVAGRRGADGTTTDTT